MHHSTTAVDEFWFQYLSPHRVEKQCGTCRSEIVGKTTENFQSPLAAQCSVPCLVYLGFCAAGLMRRLRFAFVSLTLLLRHAMTAFDPIRCLFTRFPIRWFRAVAIIALWDCLEPYSRDSHRLIVTATAESKIIFFSGQNITSALFVLSFVGWKSLFWFDRGKFKAIRAVRMGWWTAFF